MSQPKENHVATVLRSFAEKLAADKNTGAPDRMTVADGQGGITASKADIPKDPGEKDLKEDLPNDSPASTSDAEPGGSPDRMTVADGQGGVTASKADIPADSGEKDVKKDLPADAPVREASKSASRVERIRNLVLKARGEDVPPADAEKQAAEEGKKPEDVADVPAAEKQASPENPTTEEIQFSQDTLAKIATAVLADDEGVRYVHGLLEKQAGEAAAVEQIQAAMQAAETFDVGSQIKSATFNDLHEKTAAIYEQLQEAGITEEEAGDVIKQAAFHQEQISKLDHPQLKMAYVQGMDDAALLAAADEAAGQEGVPAVDEALPMGGEEMGEEEILALLQEMIENGEITEEDVQAALAAEAGAGGEEAAAPAAEVA